MLVTRKNVRVSQRVLSSAVDFAREKKRNRGAAEKEGSSASSSPELGFDDDLEHELTAAEANLALQETACKIQAAFRGKKGRKSAWVVREEKFKLEEQARLVGGLGKSCRIFRKEHSSMPRRCILPLAPGRANARTSRVTGCSFSTSDPGAKMEIRPAAPRPFSVGPYSSISHVAPLVKFHIACRASRQPPVQTDHGENVRCATRTTFFYRRELILRPLHLSLR